MDVGNGESELIYLDENICPPGCEKTLYDMAFSMREKRYACEHQIREAQQTMETLHKEIQIHTKKLKIIESDLKKNEDDLKLFMVLTYLICSIQTRVFRVRSIFIHGSFS